MNLFYHQHIPADFHASSKVWIYQSSRLFSISEALQLEPMFDEFVQNWKSHGTPVKGFAGLLFGQFIVIMADETATGVSGCSTDSSVRLIKQIEQEFKINLFDRQTLAFIVKDKIELLPFSQFAYAVHNNFIYADTLFFNNLVATKEQLLHNWIVPLKESWLASKLKKAMAVV